MIKAPYNPDGVLLVRKKVGRRGRESLAVRYFNAHLYLTATFGLSIAITVLQLEPSSAFDGQSLKFIATLETDVSFEGVIGRCRCTPVQ